MKGTVVRSRKRLIPKEIDNDNDDDTLNGIHNKKKE
jgi:hypothetical protein